jgi:hypothetical protein
MDSGFTIKCAVVACCACAPQGSVCDELPACGGASEGPVAPATSPERGWFEYVLEAERSQLHQAVGQYLDGSLPAYEGTLVATFVSGENEPRSTSGYAVGVLDETHPLGSNAGGPVTHLRLFAPGSDFVTGIAQAHGDPAVLFGGNNGSSCSGSATSFIDPPERITLSDIQCSPNGEAEDWHLEIAEASLTRLDPQEIRFEDLVDLRAAGIEGVLPEIGNVDACPNAAILERHDEQGWGDTNCSTQIEYRSVWFVRTDCPATHGIAELEIQSAEECCCDSTDCGPTDYRCHPL